MTALENKLLAACFFEPTVPTLVSVDTEIFADPNNKILAEAVQSLTNQNTGITQASLIAEIKRLGYHKNVWDSYVAGIYTQYTPEDYDHIVSVLQELKRKRIAKSAAEKLLREIEDNKTLEESMTSFNLIMSGKDVNADQPSMSDLSRDIYEKARSSRTRFEETGEYDVFSLKCGMDPVDEKINFKPGEMYVLAARPGMGKTSFILQMIQGFEKFGYGVMGSFEMRNRDMAARRISQKTGISASDLTQGTFEDPQKWDQFLNAVLDERDSKVIPYDGTKYIDDFCSRLRQYKMTHDIKWAFLDHLGKVLVKMHRAGMHEKYTSISNKLSDIAQELDIVMVALSQLGRDVDKRTPPRPRVSDIRGSGAIEEDAAGIILLYRPEYYEIFDDVNGNALNEGHTEILIPKNRFGTPNQVAIMDFQKEYSRFNEPLTASF